MGSAKRLRAILTVARIRAPIRAYMSVYINSVLEVNRVVFELIGER